MERQVLASVRVLDSTLNELSRRYSLPAAMIALALQLNTLGRAHISAGLLTAADLRELVKDACQFDAPIRRRPARIDAPRSRS
jgi:hypothetical protein